MHLHFSIFLLPFFPACFPASRRLSFITTPIRSAIRWWWTTTRVARSRHFTTRRSTYGTWRSSNRMTGSVGSHERSVEKSHVYGKISRVTYTRTHWYGMGIFPIKEDCVCVCVFVCFCETSCRIYYIASTLSFGFFEARLWVNCSVHQPDARSLWRVFSVPYWIN